jgi:hypothetical protein
LLIDVRERGSRRASTRRHADLIRIAIGDLATAEDGGAHRMHSYARAAWLEAGMRGGMAGDADLALVRAGLTLVTASGVLRG